MKIFFRLLSFSKPYSAYIPQYIITAILGIVFGAFNFSMLIPLLDVLFSKIDTNTITPEIPEFSLSIDYVKGVFNHYVYEYAKEDKLHALYFICSIILISVFLSNLFKFSSQSILTKMRTNIVYKLRKAVYEKLSNLHLGYFTNQKKGNLMSVISNDISEIENSVVSSIQAIFKEPLMIIIYFSFLFFISVKLTLFTLFFLPISALIITYISKKLRKKASHVQQLLGNIMSVTEELISGIRIIKAFNAQEFAREKFDKENKDYRKVTKSIINKRELASPFSEFLGVAVVVSIVIYGGKLVLANTGELNASMFITYLVFYSQILSPAKSISSAITNVQRGLAAGERVLKILDTPEETSEEINAKSIHAFTDSLEFKNVSFSYTKGDEGYVLKNIDLSIKKGKAIALVGQSGSGKTTLADMVPRFYDPSSGIISIDNHNIKELKLSHLRSLIGVVSQESILFNDTVFNNISFGVNNANEQQVIEAAKIANAHEFIIQMPDRYQTNIGDRGSKLSGGQRQRLSIARAIFKNPPILILDEATSALDTESEKLVQDALTNLMKNRTSIIIAHRLSTIQHADEIVVLQKGEVIERGTHAQLISKNGAYKKLYDLQLFA